MQYFFIIWCHDVEEISHECLKKKQIFYFIIEIKQIKRKKREREGQTERVFLKKFFDFMFDGWINKHKSSLEKQTRMKLETDMCCETFSL